jgi:hypothetical protein
VAAPDDESAAPHHIAREASMVRMGDGRVARVLSAAVEPSCDMTSGACDGSQGFRRGGRPRQSTGSLRPSRTLKVPHRYRLRPPARGRTPTGSA